MSDTARHLRLDGPTVRANIETARHIIPVEVTVDDDPAIAAAVGVILDRLHAAAVEQVKARREESLGRLALARQRTTRLLAGKPDPSRAAHRWTA